MPGFCRDCLEPFEHIPSTGRCRVCGRPRLLGHPELFELAIAHIDCDAFFAAVEKRDNPDLTDKPLIIGGGRRGVVSTACYIARTYGVHSAMPMFQARKACPQAVVLPPDRRKYQTASRQVFALMREVTPLVEPLSVDEAFLDLSGTERLHKHPPAQTLATLAERITREIGITVSVGLSYNKFLAKLASDMDKPRGFAVIGRQEARSFLAKLPVTRIFGVGKAFAARLGRDGIRTVGQIQAISERDMATKYGAMGYRLARLSRGHDNRTVEPRGLAKSISAETTFERDIADYQELKSILWKLCEKVATRLKKAGLSCGGVTLKLKTAQFRTLTRSKQLANPTQLADVLFLAAKPLLQSEATGRRFRLIGFGVSHLSTDFADDAPPDLIDQSAAVRAKTERAIDHVRDRFGADAIIKGRALGRRPPAKS